MKTLPKKNAAKLLTALTAVPLALSLVACQSPGKANTAQTCDQLSSVKLSGDTLDAKALDEISSIADKAQDRDLKKALEDLADLAGKDSSSASDKDVQKTMDAVQTITDKCPTLKNA